MRKWLLLLLLLLPIAAKAQVINISGVVSDPGGNVWSGATMNVDLVVPSNATAQVLVGGSVFQQHFVTTLSGAGGYSLTVYDNNQISDGLTPSGTQWQFSICAGTSTRRPCYSTTMTITGASTQTINITTTGVLLPGLGLNPAGNIVFSGNNTHSGTESFSGPMVNTGTDSGNQTISGNKTFSGTNGHTGAETFASINGGTLVDGVVYPFTSTGIQAAIAAGCNGTTFGTVNFPMDSTIPLATALLIVSSCQYNFNGAKFTNAAFTSGSNTCNGFPCLIYLNGVSNVQLRGRLILDASKTTVSGQNGTGLDITLSSDVTVDDLEVLDSQNDCLEIEGSSHVQMGKVRCDSGGALASNTSGSILISPNGGTSSSNVQISDIYTTDPRNNADTGAIFLDGSASYPNTAIQIGHVYCANFGDNCLEADYTSGSLDSIEGASTVSSVANQLLLLRQTSDFSVGSVNCYPSSTQRQCTAIGNFSGTDGSTQRIAISSITANSITGGSDAAVLINSSAVVSNIHIGRIDASGSTKGIECRNSGAAPNHITIDTVTVYKNLGAGVALGTNGGPCNDVAISNLQSYDNNQSGGASGGGNEDGIDVLYGTNITVSNARVFDDQTTKTQQDAYWISSNASNVTLVGDFNPANEKSGGNFNGGTGDSILNIYSGVVHADSTTQLLPATSSYGNLPSVPAAGIMVYCTNCTTASTCASGGSGHMAVSNGSTWTCQ